MADKNVNIHISTTANQQGARNVADELDRVKRAGEKAGTEITAAATKGNNALKIFAGTLRGAILEVPALGRVASLFVNPITAAVGAIVAGFTLWKRRVDDLRNAMGGRELLLNLPKPGEIAGKAQEYDTLAGALGRIAENVDRANGKLSLQLDLQQKLLLAQKNLALAGAETPAEQRAIEAQFAALGVSANTEAQRKIIAARIALADEQTRAGQAALAAAGAGRIPGAGAEAALGERAAALLKRGQEGLGLVRGRRGIIAEAEGGGFFGRRFALLRLAALYGIRGFGDTAPALIERARGIESERERGALQDLEVERDFRAQQADWAHRRGLRAQGRAAIAAGQASFVGAFDAEQRLGLTAANATEVNALNARTGALKALSENRQTEAGLLEQIRGVIESGKMVSEAVIAELQRVREDNARIVQQLRNGRNP